MSECAVRAPRPDFSGVRAAFVDLDGTLIHTAPDLAAAANAMLAEDGFDRLSEETIAGFIGMGIGELVRRTLAHAAGRAPAEAEIAPAQARFERHYERVSGTRSSVYPGVTEGLDALRARGIRLACVTNKAERFTLPLLRRHGLAERFESVVCGDMLAARKPDPAPFLHLCRSWSLAPSQALVVGDSENDAWAARAAGCRLALVSYGYAGGKPLHELGGDVVVSSLAALKAMLASA